MTLAPAAAAALAGLVAGSVIVGGPWQRPPTGPIAAAAVVRQVRGAAPALDAFRATYSIHETGFSAEVPERVLRMEVAFLSPQRFRLDVGDRTDYPTRSWTPTDLTYIENVSATYTSGPSGCPGDLAPGVCPPTRETVTHISRFSAAAPLPGDLILPVSTFGSARGLDVVGRERLGDREAIRVRLSFSRAAPMFPFLRIGGSWRPFFDRDRVVLWLDARSWIPLRSVVFPSRSPERREWELRYGRPVEPPDLPILDVRTISASEDPPDASLFEIPGASRGVAVTSLRDVARRVGYRPATPSAPDGLTLVSVLLPEATAATTPRSLLVYADGLDYLRIGERRGWGGPGPFGPVDAVAQQVPLDGGVGYYEPAGEGFGRRVALHTSQGDLYLETNLSRERLLAIASSIPVRGEPLPPAWTVRSASRIRVEPVGVEAALALAELPPALGRLLPAGYVLASAELASAGSTVEGITFHLRQRDMDATGEPLTLHVEPAAGLPPPSSADQSRVTVRGVTGRWTPDRGLLEWIGPGGYRSLQGDLGLSQLLSVAAAIAEAEG